MKRIISLLLVAILVLGSTTLSFAETNEPSTWAADSINEMKAYGEFRTEAFEGYQSNITREQFIYIAVRVFELLDGKEIVVDKSIAFNDTEDTYALKGATVKISSGTGNGNFSPDSLLTREQLAVLMVNTLKLADKELKASDDYVFTDDSTFSSWAKEGIYLAKMNGLIGGVGNDKFDAKGNATVEQALIIANKMLINNGFEAEDTTTMTDVELSTEDETADAGLGDEFWSGVTKNDETTAILEGLPEGTEYNTEGGVIVVGTTHYLSQGYLDIYPNSIDTVQFRITGWTQSGVQESTEKFLTLWFGNDGQEIFDEFSKAMGGTDIEAMHMNWVVLDGGTEYTTTGEGQGVSIFVKK